MIIKSLQTDSERKACLEIARNLSEWFNDAGLKAIEEDLKSESTFITLDKKSLVS